MKSAVKFQSTYLSSPPTTVVVDCAHTPAIRLDDPTRVLGEGMGLAPVFSCSSYLSHPLPAPISRTRSRRRRREEGCVPSTTHASTLR